MWPAFALLTVVDAVVLARLPFVGGRANLVGSFLLAGFLNLAVVAVLARAGGALLRRRWPTLPREIAADRAGAAGMAALTVFLVVGGMAHRPAIVANDGARASAIAAAQRFAGHQAPAAYLPGLHGARTWQQSDDLFRVCFPGPDPRRDWCVFVRTDEAAPIVRRDPDQRPNATIAGPDNPGRSGG